MAHSVPEPVARAWGWHSAETSRLAGGLINETHVVVLDGMRIAVLQRLHPIFAATVNLDIEAVTQHLHAKHMSSPALVRTLRDDAWFEHEGRVWRALTYIEGVTVDQVPDPTWADAAGELVGKFHRAVADFHHEYNFARAGVHDTASHLKRLAEHADAAEAGDDRELAREILAVAAGLPEMPETPRRHCHGDLKISNVRFTIVPSTGVGAQPPYGNSLVDLDTVGLGTMAFELGDAMRSWCNPDGEDAGRVRFDLPIFEAAMRGFRRRADPITSADERRSIVVGLETVCVELAARFAVDVFRDEYFGWDAARFPSRREHNRVRARGQFALGVAVRHARGEALDIVQRGA